VAVTVRFIVTPEVPPEHGGGFAHDSFNDLLHREVTQPGLDPAWAHTLVAVAVADDRSHAEVTVHSAPRAPKSLDRNLRLATWQPAAHIKAHDEDGAELALAKLDAPLQVGEHVEVAGQRHRVAAVDWPHRDPDSGTCHVGLDYQHVTLAPDPAPAHLPTEAQ
jgi:hypothetical protein